MASETRFAFGPDYAIPPGVTLRDTLEALGMTQAELATRAGRPAKTINEIAQGTAAITPETALQFERVLGVPASFWLNREQHYREALARRAEQDVLRQDLDWVRAFPVTQMVKLGWLPAASTRFERMQLLLQYFGVAQPRQWEQVTADAHARFRITQAHAASPEALHAWLRRGETTGRHMACAPFDKAAFKSVLGDLRSLTLEAPATFQPELIRRCAAVGVAVAFVPELQGSRASGATRWLSPNKALIQLSLRYKTDDQLWFTFFHEAGHVLLHGRKDIFIDGGGEDADGLEAEADSFAAEALIPRTDWLRFVDSLAPPRIRAAAVMAFAVGQGIAPGLVIGRLQHEQVLAHTHLNSLKRTLEWKTPAPSPSAR